MSRARQFAGMLPGVYVSQVLTRRGVHRSAAGHAAFTSLLMIMLVLAVAGDRSKGAEVRPAALRPAGGGRGVRGPGGDGGSLVV
ncbi:hypothetical protein [Saccharopolyspora shandongensis]|uniref:hypothetical protein n=1 Tax=Saccharopolyspora shandongensis TaxID=418495 RepID=UPI003404563E